MQNLHTLHRKKGNGISKDAIRDMVPMRNPVLNHGVAFRKHSCRAGTF